MSNETRRKVIEALAETDRFIAIESPRCAETRPAATAKLLASYIAHRAKLAAMLAPAASEG